MATVEFSRNPLRARGNNIGRFSVGLKLTPAELSKLEELPSSPEELAAALSREDCLLSLARRFNDGLIVDYMGNFTSAPADIAELCRRTVESALDSTSE